VCVMNESLLYLL